MVAGVHSHSNYDPNLLNGNDIPSPDDIDGAEFMGMNAYISTPKGELLKYNVETNETTRISKSVPSDPDHPKRSNKIASPILPKDEPTRGTKEIIMDNLVVPLLEGAEKIKS